MNIFAWLLFGLIVGIIANIIDPKPASGGIFTTIILGIIGALVGGFLGNVLFGVNLSGFSLSSFIVAILGSVIVLYIGKSISDATPK